MARIDRLSEDTKRLVRTASVLGREFPQKLLDRIWDGAGALHPHLLELKRLEFVYERAGAEEPVYVFKHALTQDVAYDGLLTHRRQTLHGAAGPALEGVYADPLVGIYSSPPFPYAPTEIPDNEGEAFCPLPPKPARAYVHRHNAAHPPLSPPH